MDSTMITDLTHVSLLVEDQDEALRFYTETLGMEKREDEPLEEGGRWLTVSPPAAEFPRIALDPAGSEASRARVGAQVADFTTFALETDDCRGTHETLRERGVEFHREPRERPWGIETVFEDLYGNEILLFEALPDGE